MRIIIELVKNKKVTTFLILGSFLLIFSLIMFFYYLPEPGGESMASFGYMLYFAISIFMIITDRLLVKIVKPRLLSILELLVIIAFVSTIYILHKIG